MVLRRHEMMSMAPSHACAHKPSTWTQPVEDGENGEEWDVEDVEDGEEWAPSHTVRATELCEPRHRLV